MSAYENRFQEATNRLTGSWVAEVDARAHDLKAFLQYFNDAETPEQSWQSGCWDFSCHILKPKLVQLLGPPFEKTALEIGYGGGRLLHAACRHFRRAIGVDVHGHRELVASLLAARGITNAELHQTDGRLLPLGDAEVDCVYSFIVLQHLATLDVLRQNLVEVRRVLRPGGAAILYFGYLSGQSWWRLGFQDLTTRTLERTRDVTLRLTMPCARRLLAGLGLRVHELRRSHKRPWRTDYGGQFYAIVTR